MFSPAFYKFIHLFAFAIIIGYAFYACVVSAEARKRAFFIIGLSVLLVVVSGIALTHQLGDAWLSYVWSNLNVYKYLHYLSLAVVTGLTFYSFAAPAESRKRVLMFAGIASLVMLVCGIGLMHKLHYAWLGWVWVKMICWLGLTAISGIAYRRRSLVPKLKLAAIVLLALGVYMAVYKPAIF